MRRKSRLLVAGLRRLRCLYRRVAAAFAAEIRRHSADSQHFDSPASMSIHEESTITAGMPMMGVFNNLVLFDQHVPQNSFDSIVPDLATSWRGARTGRS